MIYLVRQNYDLNSFIPTFIPKFILASSVILIDKHL